jgi:thiol:disulfide interchange protein
VLSRLIAALLILAALYPLSLAVAARDAKKIQASTDRMVFSEARIAELHTAGRAVLVDMTADWCITCKVNEANALNTYRVGQLMKETNTAYLVGDYTLSDPMIGAYLKKMGAVGVPLYVIYPKVGEPEVLPQVLSESLVLDAIKRAN